MGKLLLILVSIPVYLLLAPVAIFAALCARGATGKWPHQSADSEWFYRAGMGLDLPKARTNKPTQPDTEGR